MKIRKTLRLILAFTGGVALILLLSACQPTPPAADEGPDDAESTEGQAETGGSVVFATSGPLEIYTTIFSSFTEETGISVEVLRAPPEQITERLLSEAAANRSSIDLIEIPANTLLALHGDGHIADFQPAEAEAYPADLKFGEWGVADRMISYAMAYNNRLATEEELSSLTEVTDLTDPAWQGRIAMEFPERGAGGGFAFYYTLFNRGMVDQAFFEMMAANTPVFGRSATPLTTQLVAGDFAVYTNGEIALVEEFKGNGAPIDWIRQPWIFVLPVPIAMNADAPHREAAEQAYNYLLSEEAQQILAEQGEGPSRPGVVTPWWPEGYDPELIVSDTPTPEETQEFVDMLVEIFNR